MPSGLSGWRIGVRLRIVGSHVQRRVFGDLCGVCGVCRIVFSWEVLEWLCGV